LTPITPDGVVCFPNRTVLHDSLLDTYFHRISPTSQTYEIGFWFVQQYETNAPGEIEMKIGEWTMKWMQTIDASTTSSHFELSYMGSFFPIHIRLEDQTTEDQSIQTNKYLPYHWNTLFIRIHTQENNNLEVFWNGQQIVQRTTTQPLVLSLPQSQAVRFQIHVSHAHFELANLFIHSRILAHKERSRYKERPNQLFQIPAFFCGSIGCHETHVCGFHGTCESIKPGFNGNCICEEGFQGIECQRVNQTFFEKDCPIEHPEITSCPNCTVCKECPILPKCPECPECSECSEITRCPNCTVCNTEENNNKEITCFSLKRNERGVCGWRWPQGNKMDGDSLGACVDQDDCECFDGHGGLHCEILYEDEYRKMYSIP